MVLQGACGSAQRPRSIPPPHCGRGITPESLVVGNRYIYAISPGTAGIRANALLRMAVQRRHPVADLGRRPFLPRSRALSMPGSPVVNGLGNTVRETANQVPAGVPAEPPVASLQGLRAFVALRAVVFNDTLLGGAANAGERPRSVDLATWRILWGDQAGRWPRPAGHHCNKSGLARSLRD